MQTLTTYLHNWSDEKATVKFTKAGSFKFGGYSFSIKNVETIDFESDTIENGGWFNLEGEGWEDSLATIHFQGEPDMKVMVRKALIWVANHV